MAVLKIVVCDRCETPDRPTKKYRVGTEKNLHRLLLCDECANLPLATLLKGVKRGGYKVTPVAEVGKKVREQRELASA